MSTDQDSGPEAMQETEFNESDPEASSSSQDPLNDGAFRRSTPPPVPPPPPPPNDGAPPRYTDQKPPEYSEAIGLLYANGKSVYNECANEFANEYAKKERISAFSKVL